MQTLSTEITSFILLLRFSINLFASSIIPSPSFFPFILSLTVCALISSNIGKVKDIKILRRSEAGRVKELEIIGTKGKYRVKGDWNVRKALGNLKSSFFVFKKKGDSIIFKGGGWGHGIGMC